MAYSDQGRVTVTGNVGSLQIKDGITTKEVILGESILNPSVQTAVTFTRYIYGKEQNLDQIKGRELNLTINSPLTQGMVPLRVNNIVYRLDNRRLVSQSPSALEEFTIHACDKTLLGDAKHLMSKSWQCATPDKIVKDALQCVGADGVSMGSNIQPAQPERDYIAENIHPFRVIAQQANAALDGEDPSFVHYMTYGLGGTGDHHFTSLKKLISQQKKMSFYYSELGESYSDNESKGPANPYPIMVSFPCDFDYLTDVLNGVDENGKNINTGSFFNLMNMGFNFLGIGGAAGMPAAIPGGMGNGCFEGGNFKQSWTNKGGAHDDYGCQTDVEKYLLKRQARMAILDRDKVAMRMVTTWNPYLHVGDIIELTWENKYNGGSVYGTGQYLITEIMHKIQLGGYSTTTMDCVSKDTLQKVMG